MLVLLSPAKKLDYTTPVTTEEFTQPIFLDESQRLINKLKKLKPKAIGDLMHLSPTLSDLNYERYQNFETPFTLENAKQAIFAFNGEVYTGLDAYNLSAEEIQKAQQNVRLLSGLYGLLKPLDLMYPYRLEMGTKFQSSPTKKNLYDFWGSKITNEINKELTNHNYVVNLASIEYFKSVKKKELIKPIITPTFKDEKNGQLKTIMVFAKKARGSMANYVIKNQPQSLEELQAFDTGGYRFEPSLSTELDWTFVR